jgi:hypothetical protein
MNYMTTVISYTLSAMKIVGQLWLNAGNDTPSSLFLRLTSSTYSLQVQRVTFASDHTQWHTYTVGRTHLVEGSATRMDLHLTTHNIHKRQTSMPLAGFELAIPASERPHTYVLDSAAVGRQRYSLLRIPHRRTCQTVHWTPRKTGSLPQAKARHEL